MSLQHQKEQVRSVTKNIILCPVFFSQLKSRNNPNSIRKSSSNTNIGASQRATIKSSSKLKRREGSEERRGGRNVLSALLPPVHKENAELGCEIQQNLN